MLKIVIRPSSHPASDVSGAIFAMNKFHNELNPKIVQDDYILKLPNDDKVEVVMKKVMSLCPGVHLALDSTDSLKVKIYLLELEVYLVLQFLLYRVYILTDTSYADTIVTLSVNKEQYRYLLSS